MRTRRVVTGRGGRWETRSAARASSVLVTARNSTSCAVAAVPPAGGASSSNTTHTGPAGVPQASSDPAPATRHEDFKKAATGYGLHQSVPHRVRVKLVVSRPAATMTSRAPDEAGSGTLNFPGHQRPRGPSGSGQASSEQPARSPSEELSTFKVAAAAGRQSSPLYVLPVPNVDDVVPR